MALNCLLMQQNSVHNLIGKILFKGMVSSYFQTIQIDDKITAASYRIRLEVSGLNDNKNSFLCNMSL